VEKPIEAGFVQTVAFT